MMADELLNLDLLIKTMKMTTVAEDTVALVAIRKANAILDKFGGDWEKLLRGKVTVVADPFGATPVPPSNNGTGWATPTMPAGRPSSTNSVPPRPAAPPLPPRPAAPPPPPPPPPAPTPRRENLFGGSCCLCGTYVQAKEGWASKPTPNSSWRVEHKTCPKVEITPITRTSSPDLGNL